MVSKTVLNIYGGNNENARIQNFDYKKIVQENVTKFTVYFTLTMGIQFMKKEEEKKDKEKKK